MTPFLRPFRSRRPACLRSLSLAAALLLRPVLVGQETPTFSEVTVHDPSVVRHENTFYVFGSHLASASSTDLQHWTQLSTNPVAGNPLAPNPQAEFQEAIAWVSGDYGFWAPDVFQLPDGRFAYYYCIGRLDQPRAALGLAFANQITGPYEHAAILLRSGPGGQPPEAGAVYDARIHPNTIDPALFRDRDGQLWMVYGSYSGGIFILRMDDTTGLPLPGQGYGKKLIGGNHARIEGAYILYHPETDYFYLFVSYGGLGANDGYNIRLGRSRQPDGPYVDAAGTDLTTVAGAPGTLFDDASIAPHGVKLMGGYQFLAVAGEPRTQSRGYLSPGHNSAYHDPATGRSFLVFHTRFVGRGEQHEVRVHQLFVTPDDWLVAAPHRYAGESLVRTDATQVQGSYKLINHGKAITSQVATSSVITLQADGTVSGAASGTWALSGDADATLTVNGATYRGVYLRQWDDDQQRWVRAFSALSDDGVVIWGSKVVPSADAAPTISTQPASVSVSPGEAVTLAVVVNGAPEPTYQWHKDGAPIAGATASELTLPAVTAADAGTYTVVATNRAGSVTSAEARVSVAASAPEIALPPLDVHARTGSTVVLTVSAPGATTYQWRRDGIDLPGATGAFLVLDGITAAQAGAYAVVVGNAHGTTTSEASQVTVAAGGTSRIDNLSVRTNLAAGGNLIVGFYSLGPKTMLVRAAGPALATVAPNLSPLHADPAIALYAGQTRTDENDDWGNWAEPLDTTFAAVGAFPFPGGSADAALRRESSGARTAHVGGPGSGILLVEVYDSGGDGELQNVSARNHVGTGADVLIAGFTIAGTAAKTVVIRGLGPRLAELGVPGVLADPRLEVFAAQTPLARSEDWDPSLTPLAHRTGAAGLPLAAGARDAGLVLTLNPGGYTAVVSGADGGTGEALVEIYALP